MPVVQVRYSEKTQSDDGKKCAVKGAPDSGEIAQASRGFRAHDA